MCERFANPSILGNTPRDTNAHQQQLLLLMLWFCFICTYMCVHVYTYMCVCVYICMCLCVHMYVCRYTYICVYVYSVHIHCTQVYICMCVFVYTIIYNVGYLEYINKIILYFLIWYEINNDNNIDVFN